MISISPFCDAAFLSKYLSLRRSPYSHNELIEKPATYSLLPRLKDSHVLDLGCGYGEFSKYAIDMGACHVVSVDISNGMLELAKSLNGHPQISYVMKDINDIDIGIKTLDIVFSALTLHYVLDYSKLVKKIKAGLKPRGALIFSVEHPIMTAQESGWEIGVDGNKAAWRLDSYGIEGPRVCRWLDFEVTKYHRKVETYLSELLASGFNITGLLEPQPTSEILTAYPRLGYELMRPPFLAIAAQLR